MATVWTRLHVWSSDIYTLSGLHSCGHVLAEMCISLTCARMCSANNNYCDMHAVILIYVECWHCTFALFLIFVMTPGYLYLHNSFPASCIGIGHFTYYLSLQ